MVDIKVKNGLDSEITIDELKIIPELKNMILLNNTRLSVQPVTKDEWNIIVSLRKLKDI